MGGLPILTEMNADLVTHKSGQNPREIELLDEPLLSQRMPIFRQILSACSASLADIGRHRGPSRDALENWAAGKVKPRKDKLEELRLAARKTLTLKGHTAEYAEKVALWLVGSSPPKKKARVAAQETQATTKAVASKNSSSVTVPPVSTQETAGKAATRKAVAHNSIGQILGKQLQIEPHLGLGRRRQRTDANCRFLQEGRPLGELKGFDL